MLTSHDKYIIYDYKKILGCGTFADVFLGIGQDDGSLYAFKCLKSNTVDMEKEENIMKSLDHENILKYFDTLIGQFNNYRRIIVTEYCNKGSLQTFYENIGGLCDNMFLLLLECLSEGVAYLKQKCVLHRDIKPGNVMVHQDSMGDYHMKIGDLGTAKALQDDQTFNSMVGTSEYMDPDIFLRYIGENSMTKHSITTDLWSIAVTLYQSATLELPYVPFHPPYGHLYLQALEYMYRNRRPGFISCVQNSDDDTDVTWSKSLPGKCKLSPMLRNLASDIIGHLMDPKVDDGYERFFSEAQSILSKKRLLVFSTWNGELQLFYIEDLSHESLARQVHEVWGLTTHNGHILTKCVLMEHCSKRAHSKWSRSVSRHGHLQYHMTDDTVFVIKNSSSIDDKLFRSSHCLGDCVPPSTEYTSLENAQTYSEDVLRNMHRVNYHSNYIDCQTRCFIEAAHAFNAHIRKGWTMENASLTTNIESLRMESDILSYMVRLLTELLKSTGHYDNFEVDIGFLRSKMEAMVANIEEAEKCREQYAKKIIDEQGLDHYARSLLSDDLVTDVIDCLVHCTEESINEARMIIGEKILTDIDKLFEWQRLVRHYQYNRVAQAKLAVKRNNAEKSHHLFSKSLTTTLDFINRKEKLLIFFTRLNKKASKFFTHSVMIKHNLEKLIRYMNQSNDATVEEEATLMTPGIIQERIREIEDIINHINDARNINKLTILK